MRRKMYKLPEIYLKREVKKNKSKEREKQQAEM